MWKKLFTGRERRRFVRIPVELNVDFKTRDENADSPWHRGSTRDISPEGICLVTDVFAKERWREILKEKSHLLLHLNFPAKKIKAEAEVRTIDVEAKVIWQENKKRDGKDVCLLGLHFATIEKSSQEIIRSFIIDNLVKSYRPV